MGTYKQYYFMTSIVFQKILKREGKPPTCEQCGKILYPNKKERIISKLRVGRKDGTAHAKRYCEQCRKK